ncbi:MAG: sialate O-acetylesterase [Flavisolibacter sp.]
MRKLLFIFICCITARSEAQVRLPRLVRDSMVLQRGDKTRIWGWASPNEKIKIQFRGKAYRTRANSNGDWLLRFSAGNAGGPFTMTIDAKNHLTIQNILIGDVWLCSGQSNMVHQMDLHRDLYQQEIEQTNNSMIRHFFVPTLTNLQMPQQDLPTGFWKSATPTDLPQFSAVAWFFAKTIYEKYHVPIGLINSSVGGTPIEAWISEDGLKEFPNILNRVEKNKDTAYVNSTNRAAFARAPAPRPQDKGWTSTPPWYDVNYIPKQWHNITIPGYWEDQGIRDLDGVVWYRKEIDVPASMTGVPARIFMGRIVDADIFYVNGKMVGSTTYMYPQRRYNLAPGVLKPGKNLLVIRVTNFAGKGGFVPDKPYFIAAGGDTLSLRGDWKYKVADAFRPQQMPGGISMQNQPTGLFNAMIAPFTNYSIKGILWYQGEANTGNAEEYASLQPALVRDWRKQWGEGDVPFLYVQLPNFMEVQYLPSSSNWALLREAQLKSISVPNTAMAVAIDLGEWNDIHPLNKKDVGIRLALAAEALAYGEKNLEYSGPIYQSSTVDGNKITISFTHTGSGLIAKDSEELSQFAIAGADKKFVWAHARIEGDKVVVWSDEVSNPLYVRYAWADNPDGANLFNREGLPASPFRTDQ